MNTRPQSINKSEALENAITAALEQPAAPAIRADFAARVTAQAVNLPKRSRAPRAHYARSVAILLSAAMVVALFIVAPHAQPDFSSVGFQIELTVIVLLGALVYWLTRAPKESL